MKARNYLLTNTEKVNLIAMSLMSSVHSVFNKTCKHSIKHFNKVFNADIIDIAYAVDQIVEQGYTVERNNKYITISNF